MGRKRAALIDCPWCNSQHFGVATRALCKRLQPWWKQCGRCNKRRMRELGPCFQHSK